MDGYTRYSLTIPGRFAPASNKKAMYCPSLKKIPNPSFQQPGLGVLTLWVKFLCWGGLVAEPLDEQRLYALLHQLQLPTRPAPEMG